MKRVVTLALAIMLVGAAAACEGDPPTVTRIDPSNGATGVSTRTSVVATLSSPADYRTVNGSNLRLLRPDGSQVPANFNSDGAGGIVSVTPVQPLSGNTRYTFQLTSGLKDTSGASFQPLTIGFTTGAAQSTPTLPFKKARVANVLAPTAASFGPDGKLYVSTMYGEIFRYGLNPTTGAATSSERLVNLPGRTILGMAWDPGATASNLKLWFTNSQAGDKSYGGNPQQFTGKITVASGAGLSSLRDVITGLPRSNHDHMTNGVAWNNGLLYVTQGANTGYGDVDAYWGLDRPETPLAATVLEADVNGITGTLNVATPAYNPNAAGAKVRIFASGVRNAYTPVWATYTNSSGATVKDMYTAVNESANGNAPASPDGKVPALKNLRSGADFMARILRGKYYGHPNPSVGKYVLMGGNPTDRVDPWAYEGPGEYPVGVAPDPQWQRPANIIGDHRSPNGMVQYTSGAFNGAIRGHLLVSEFSNGDDIVAMRITSTGAITGQRIVADGFNNPLGIATNAAGWLAVTEFGAQPDGSAGLVTMLVP